MSQTPPSDRRLPDALAMALLDSSADAVFVMDQAFCVRWANEVAERFFRVTLSAARGRSVFELFPETTGTPIEDTYRQAVAMSATQSAQLFFEPTRRWLSVRVVPWDDLLLAYYRDDTARHEAAEALRSSEQRYRAMAEHVGDILTVTTMDGRCLWVSPSVERVLGYSPDELRAAQLHSIVHPDDLARVRGDADGQALGTILRLRFRAQRKDGAWRWMEAAGQVVVGRDGQHEAIVVSRDDTDRVEIEQRLQAARDAAEQTVRARSAFLANMSHEIRTPLHGVLGLASLLLQGELPHQQRTYVEWIQGSSEGLLRVLDDVLDLSKIEAGRMTLTSSLTSLRDLVSDVLGTFTAAARQKELRLRMRLAPEVPSHVRVDATRLRQVLLNLVGNAIKFTDAGEVAVELSAAPVDAGWRLTCAVRDSGVGIGSEDHARLFEPFHQFDTPKAGQRRVGTGLGLSISQRLVSMMGGELSCESVIGAGTTFRFTVDAADAGPQSQETPLPRRRRSALHSDGLAAEGLQVLLAEDNELNAMVVRLQLERLGIAVEVAEDGISAVAAAQARPYDLILMDVQMPHLDGLEATRQIRADDAQPQPFIVALTASVLEHDRKQAMEVGMDEHLTKPLQFEALERILREAVTRKKARAALAALDCPPPPEASA